MGPVTAVCVVLTAVPSGYLTLAEIELIVESPKAPSDASLLGIQVDGVAIEGAEAVSAFRYASSDSSGLDSFRLVMASGGLVTVIDVQQAAADGGAEEAAVAIANAQLTCLTGGSCDAPALPGSFTGQ